MKNYTLFFLASLVILFSTGCKKKNDDTPAKTKTELIASGTWKFQSATVSGFDVSGLRPICEKDNLLTFQTNGSGTLDEGLTKCDNADPQSTTFSWNFTSNETVLHVSTVLFASGSNDFTIVSLSATQLVGSQLISGQNVVVTFVH